MTLFNVSNARCAALFVSQLQPSDAAAADAVPEVISHTVGQFGVRGCTSRMAQEFGDHPEEARDRMRWILRLVGEGSARSGPPAVRPAIVPAWRVA